LREKCTDCKAENVKPRGMAKIMQKKVGDKDLINPDLNNQKETACSK